MIPTSSVYHRGSQRRIYRPIQFIHYNPAQQTKSVYSSSSSRAQSSLVDDKTRGKNFAGRTIQRANYPVTSACTHCKQRHRRCDPHRPCICCIKDGTQSTCFDAAHRKRGRRPESLKQRYQKSSLQENAEHYQLSPQKFYLATPASTPGEILRPERPRSNPPVVNYPVYPSPEDGGFEWSQYVSRVDLPYYLHDKFSSPVNWGLLSLSGPASQAQNKGRSPDHSGATLTRYFTEAQSVSTSFPTDISKQSSQYTSSNYRSPTSSSDAVIDCWDSQEPHRDMQPLQLPPILLQRQSYSAVPQTRNDEIPRFSAPRELRELFGPMDIRSVLIS